MKSSPNYPSEEELREELMKKVSELGKIHSEEYVYSNEDLWTDKCCDKKSLYMHKRKDGSLGTICARCGKRWSK